jgi:hypothetical protein
VLQITPGSYRAEKQVNGTLVSAQGETPQALAAAAEAIDANVTAFKTDPVGAPATPAPTYTNEVITEGETDTSPEEVEVNQKTVITEDGAFTEEEWSARSKRDTVVTEDGQTIYEGVGENTEGIAEALKKTDEDAQNEENEETKDPHAGEKTQQVAYDTADSIDRPGQSAGGTIIVPEGLETLAEASQAMDALAQEAENKRVADAALIPAGEPTLAAKIEEEIAKAEKAKKAAPKKETKATAKKKDGD